MLFRSVTDFVNADVIARGLSAFETTLASRSFAPWIADLQRSGYRFSLVFIWLPSAEIALQRVRDRVIAGGHDVPEVTVRRRYSAALRNFVQLYQPIADSWRVYDNSIGHHARLIAIGRRLDVRRVSEADTWKRFEQATQRAADKRE